VRPDPEKVLELAEVPTAGEAPSLPAGPGRGHKKPKGQSGTEVSQRSGREKAVARVARGASEEVKALYVAGLISDRDAAALSPVTKGPDVLVAEERALAVVAARGAPATPKEKRRRTARAESPASCPRCRTDENQRPRGVPFYARAQPIRSSEAGAEPFRRSSARVSNPIRPAPLVHCFGERA